jgi:hypothetical protein
MRNERELDANDLEARYQDLKALRRVADRRKRLARGSAAWHAAYAEEQALITKIRDWVSR